MREDPENPRNINAFIEAIVETARIPSRRRRDELRRELHSHFEESGLTPDALQEAVARFGDSRGIGDSLRTVYRRDYRLWYLAKVAACMAVAILAAIVIEAIAGLRVDSDTVAWRLSPDFARASRFGVVLTFALVAAGEATRAPFAWSRAIASLGCYAIVPACAWPLNVAMVGAFLSAGVLAVIGVGVARAPTAWTSRAFLTLAAFTVVEYLVHQSSGIAFGPIRALAASTILLMLWASTITIVMFADRVFASVFRTT